MGISELKKANHGLDTESFIEERVDLACAFRWTHRLDMHESVANHFSLAVSDDGSRFLINPDGRHFSRIKASELVLVDANDRDTMDRADAPDPTAWGLHGAIHRNCPQARCVLHVHPVYATVRTPRVFSIGWRSTRVSTAWPSRRKGSAAPESSVKSGL